MSTKPYKTVRGTISRLKIAQDISKLTGLKNADVSLTIKLFLERVREKIASGQTVKINNFGNFTIRRRKKRRHMNIHTREIEELGYDYYVWFTPSKVLKQEVSECMDKVPVDSFVDLRDEIKQRCKENRERWKKKREQKVLDMIIQKKQKE